MDGPDRVGEPVKGNKRPRARRFLLPAMLALATGVVLVLVLAIGGGGPAADGTAAEDAADAAPAETAGRAADKKGNAPKVGEVVPRKWRDVTPDGVWTGPKVSGPLVRVEGRKPPPPKPRYKRFFRVMVLTAGSIRAGGTRIHVDRIQAPPFDEFCDYREGGSWPCGRVARTALLRLIRGRAVECHLKDGKLADDLKTDCRVGKQDLAAWLVEQGWARVGDTSSKALVAAEMEAKSAKRGIWREEKPGG